MQQYRNHIGKEVEVLQKNGQKVQGTLVSVADDRTFVVKVQEKQHVEGKKRPVMVDVEKTFAMDDIKYCKYLLNFK
jgi:ribosome maturation factor RimP